MTIIRVHQLKISSTCELILPSLLAFAAGFSCAKPSVIRRRLPDTFLCLFLINNSFFFCVLQSRLQKDIDDVQANVKTVAEGLETFKAQVDEKLELEAKEVGTRKLPLFPFSLCLIFSFRMYTFSVLGGK